MVTFPSFARSTRGLFSDIHRENLVEFLEVKLTKVWMPPPVLGCLELLTLRLVHTELPTHQLQFRHWFLCKGFYSGVSTLIYDCISLSVQLGRQYSALWPHFSDRSKKSCWFSVCSALLSWGRKGECLRSSPTAAEYEWALNTLQQRGSVISKSQIWIISTHQWLEHLTFKKHIHMYLCMYLFLPGCAGLL